MNFSEHGGDNVQMNEYVTPTLLPFAFPVFPR